jgi:competence protein ComEC
VTLGERAADAAEARRETRAAALVRRLTTQLEAEQDRWFLWVPVLFGLGIFAYFKLPAEPSLLAALMPVAIVLALAAVTRTGTLGIVALNSALAVSLGFAAAKVRSDWVAAPVLERQLYRVEVEGFLETVEPRPTRGQRVTIRVTRLANLPPEQTPYRVRLRLMSAVAGLEPGQMVRLKANLAPPSMPALPGGYDFARAAWFAGLGAVGYSLDRPQIQKDAGKPPWSLRWALATERLRQVIGERVAAVLPGEEGALATALINGERGGISPETTQAFRDSGLVHLLSISGLHMVVMAGSIFYAVRLGLAAIPTIALRYPIKKWAAAIAIVGAFAYLLISGSSFPTVRAWITITIAFGAIMLDRPALALRNVALAALTIIAIAPESLFDAGFQMSFAAVVALVSAYEFIRDRAEQRMRPGSRFGPILSFLLFFGGIILTTVIASFAVAPFSAFHFNTSQQYAVLANLIAVPVCNIIVMPAALATLLAMPFGLEALPLWIMEQGIRVIVWCAYSVAQLPGAVGSIPAFSEIAMGLMLLGGLWLCLWRTRWRLLGVGIFAAGLALVPAMPRPDILVGRNAELVAVRGPQGQLSALPAQGGSYELQRWLESDGDARAPREATSDVFRCDAVGCTANIKDRAVAVVRHPAALAEDCSRADVLVIPFPRPKGCNPKAIAIDFYAVRDRGTHAVYIDDKGISVMTVADFRGDRPWSRQPERPRRSRRPEQQKVVTQTNEDTASNDLTEASRRSRPDFDDDDPMIDQLQSEPEEEP